MTILRNAHYILNYLEQSIILDLIPIIINCTRVCMFIHAARLCEQFDFPNHLKNDSDN